MTTYTAFCRDADDEDSTIWIDTVEAASVGSACVAAEAKCADDWGLEGDDRATVECIGIAEGNVKILFWED